jgi:uncharacterized protein
LKVEETMMQSHVPALLLSAILAVPAVAQEQPLRSHSGAILAVKGEGRVEVKPDYAQFHATVSTRAQTLSEATTGHEEQATRALSMLQSLKGASVEISRSSFKLQQERPSVGRQPASEKPPEPQFVAVTTFDLKARPIEALNGIITKLASSGLFEVQNVTFLVDREREVLNEARRAAVHDARDQAEVYADAGGVRLADIDEIADGQATPVRRYEADVALSPSVQIIPPATLTFTASVRVVWHIAPR